MPFGSRSPEVNNRYVRDTLEQMGDGCRIPARDMGEQPALWGGQVVPDPQVLDEQHGSELSFEPEAVHEGPLRDGNLPEHARRLSGRCRRDGSTP
jgi:hypothetical protein